jgi:DNA-binding MarR family transcriptional regulator
MRRQKQTKIMKKPSKERQDEHMALANRLFFRLYQCANMLQKTGSKALEAEGLTTTNWAVLGALSRPEAKEGMSVGELARYLKMSRQNLSGLVDRMERDGRLRTVPDAHDRRARRIALTAQGRKLWKQDAQPKIRDYYAQTLEDLSINDMAHLLHYLLKLLDNMQRVDAHQSGAEAPKSVG